MLMPVANVHERLLPAPIERVGRLFDTLASEHDELWPIDHWPPMRFDGGLRVGAAGGHGPVRYTVAQLDPARLVRFRFSAPRGLHGEHWLELIPSGADATLLRHCLLARPAGAMRWQWPLIWGPLHDALLEDALARAHERITGTPDPQRWTLWVRLLRRVLRARARS
ncbi:MAG TPA: hypothetical protein VLJ42_11550 [Solirubrobacteraceae bacterium]|nr:hypothetical protein [Solirubrobacteraceae bacterium]